MEYFGQWTWGLWLERWPSCEGTRPNNTSPPTRRYVINQHYLNGWHTSATGSQGSHNSPVIPRILNSNMALFISQWVVGDVRASVVWMKTCPAFFPPASNPSLTAICLWFESADAKAFQVAIMGRNVLILQRWGVGGTNPDTPQRRFLSGWCRFHSKPPLESSSKCQVTAEIFQSWELASCLLFYLYSATPMGFQNAIQLEERNISSGINVGLPFIIRNMFGAEWHSLIHSFGLPQLPKLYSLAPP